MGKETVSVETLLTQFLDANQIAIEDSGKTAFHYDAALWDDMSEKCKRKERNFDASVSMSKVDEDKRKRSIAAVGGGPSRAHASQDAAPALSTQFHPKGHGKSSGSVRPPRPPHPPQGQSYRKQR